MLNLTEHADTLSKQVSKNIITNILSFLFNMLVGLFLAPYFIDTLGVSSYAIIPLATSMTNYINILIQSMNISVSRYLTVDLQKKNFREANITFNTSIFGTLSIILLMLPAIILLSYYAPDFFDIETNQKFDVILLFLGVFSAFLVRAWTGNFGVSLFAYNRLDLQNIITIIHTIVSVGLIIVLFKIYSPKLIIIGFSYLVAALAAYAATIIYSRKINPHLKVNYHYFRISKVRNMLGTGGWILINQVGALLFLQIDLILVNKLYGLTAGGEYAIVLTWSTLLRSAASLLLGVLAPIIFTYYAKNMAKEVIDLSKDAIKFMGLAMALPIGFICGFAPQILNFWVGPEFVKLSPLMIVVLFHLVINLPVRGLFNINVSYNKVQIPGLVTLLMGIGNLLLAIIFSQITDWGYYGIAIAGAIMLTLKNAFFTPWYASSILGVSRTTFMRPMVSAIFAMFITAGISSLISYYMEISDVISLALYGMFLSAIYVSVVWSICLNKSERKIIESLIPSSMRRYLDT